MPHKFTLSLGTETRLSTGQAYGTGPAIGYEVLGMPPGETASIALHDQRWRVMRIRAGTGNWTGDHATARDALAVLQSEIDCEHGA